MWAVGMVRLIVEAPYLDPWTVAQCMLSLLASSAPFVILLPGSNHPSLSCSAQTAGVYSIDTLWYSLASLYAVQAECRVYHCKATWEDSLYLYIHNPDSDIVNLPLWVWVQTMRIMVNKVRFAGCHAMIPSSVVCVFIIESLEDNSVH